MTPSDKHYLRYDAQTYETQGFLEVKGKVVQMARKPRFWQITATAKTTDLDTGIVDTKHVKFTTNDRFRLGELATVVNNKMHEYDDYLPVCLSVIVVARVML